MANVHDLGDLVRCTGTFTDENGDAHDPTTVLFSVKNPAGTTTTYTYGVDAALVKDSTGVYHVDVDASAVGWYYYRFYSTGSGQASEEEKFEVGASWFD